MDRIHQSGLTAPRRGTMLQSTVTGSVNYSVPAIRQFPPPSFLTVMQRNIWNAALSDQPAEFFRARHIPMMVQYVRAIERLMHWSDLVEEDPEDEYSFKMWDKYLKIQQRLESALGFSAMTIISLSVRGRGELKRTIDDSGTPEELKQTDAREGLVYVSNG